MSLISCTWNRTDTRFIFCFVSFLPKAHFKLKMLLFPLPFILEDFQSSGILLISCNHTNISFKVNKLHHSLRVTMSPGHLKRSQTFCIMDVYVLYPILHQEIDYLTAVSFSTSSQVQRGRAIFTLNIYICVVFE